ncbi:hypothetical protein [Pseudomonas xanthosomatis]|uniref:hypothetical protein n=1 Tax=Pseudomonas xanthosomatis TaxID=2842356 RepID=UPI003516007E
MDKAIEPLMLIGATALLHPPHALGEQRQAAFDSILYAQLVANKQAGSRFADHESWYRAYRNAYHQLGWIKLAQTHDFKRLGQTLDGSRTQPLEAWLRMRSIEHEAVLAAVKAKLSGSAEGFAHLFKFAVQGNRVAVEIGVLKPGPVLDLCSITLQREAAIPHIGLDALLREQLLGGETEFYGVSLALDNGRFQRKRDELRDLMRDRDAQGAWCFDLGAGEAGGEHG